MRIIEEHDLMIIEKPDGEIIKSQTYMLYDKHIKIVRNLLLFMSLTLLLSFLFGYIMGRI